MPRAGALCLLLSLLLVTCGAPPAAKDVAGAGSLADAVDALPSARVPAVPDILPVPLPVDPPRPLDPPPPEAPARPAPEPAPAPEPPPPPPPRSVTETGWSPFATVGGVVLHHPSSRVEVVGFHESNHDGARQMAVLDTAVHPITLETRERGTGSHTAADIVSDPQVEIRAPVTGTVRRAGSYVLYCDHRDDFAVIEPDAHPGWEVKVLHINGVQVRPGDRVQAGETVLAGRPTVLPFDSQVDEHTAAPSWPHVHVEVVDPSIPDRPSPGGGC